MRRGLAASAGWAIERAAAAFNVNVAALNEERAWLHTTEWWAEAVRQMRENFVETTSGQFIPKSQLRRGFKPWSRA